ncbi:membrane protein [Mesorhizobium sp. L-8-10]|uniref:DMT family transporter n=1 Tax=Mesorhizobium sp. L-8-10 TaxID=2744523 RepID=UPI00192875BC|nr:DMT family transporter [Mesorhizobium sp. L-8-10]BCH32192.1 membrane protein [Mesorhizobium sp. L-8-10]
MRKQVEGYLYLSLAMVLVGSTVVASKVIASGLPPFTATALRFVIALPFFLVLMRLTASWWPKLTRRDWGLLFLQAAAGSVGYTTLLISGLRFTSAAHAGVIIGTLPIVSAAIAILVLGERPRRSLLLGIGLAAAGVLAITVRSGEGGDWFGNVLILAAVVCEGLFILLNKRLRTDISPLVLSSIMTMIGLATAAVAACLEVPWAITMTTGAVWAVIYYALVPTVGGFLFWYAGAARVSGAEASLFTALAPVSALFLAALLLSEPVGPVEMFGVGCVLAAVLATGLSGFFQARRRMRATRPDMSSQTR